MDKHDLYVTIDRLSPEELQELRAYLDQRIAQPQIADEDVQTKIDALHAALENFWEGLSQDEIDAIVEGMNSEYVEPLSEDNWFDEAEN